MISIEHSYNYNDLARELKEHMKAIRIILAKIRSADEDYRLFEEDDRIAIGVSGGKDSMSLLYALNLYRKYSRINFTIVPVMIDLGFPDFNPYEIEKYTAKLGLKLIIADGKKVYPILEKQMVLQHLKHLPCSICSRMKKAIIDKIAHEQNCAKVAFAHHQDDAIETLLLNEIYGARVATFSPKMYLSKEKITFIRPLIYCTENETRRLTKEENIVVLPSHCPNDGHTEREEVKNLYSDIKRLFPQSKGNFPKMLTNGDKLDLFFAHFERKVPYTNLYYRSIEKIADFLEEEAFYKGRKGHNFSLDNYTKYESRCLRRLYFAQSEEVVSSLDYAIEDGMIKILRYKYFSYEDFVYIIFDLFKKIYLKNNPLKIEIESKKKDFLKEIGFKIIHANGAINTYICKENPAEIEKNIKK
jgi:tRNA(Ile)-lysidine synthase TilS/MesJ